MPNIVALAMNYLYRMPILRAVSLLAPVMGSEITCSKLLPVVMTAAKDRCLWMVKKAWILRSGSNRISQSELAKCPDPFFLPDLLDEFKKNKYGWLADDVRRLCELKRKLFNGSVSVGETGTRQKKKKKPVKLDDVLSQESANKSGCSGSDASPESYNEEDSSRVPTDDDNGTDLYGVGEEEEEEAELWREMAFAQESSKVTVENVQDIDLNQVEDCEHSFIYKNVPPGRVVSATLNPKRNVKGAASCIEIGNNNNNKRKRIDEKPKKVSAEEKAALRAREAARKRVEDREKSLLGLYNRPF